ncbi:UNVERIFIED_CONTAM: hypothetical protein Slati_3947500 [Sesamum latifolium]|uniref:Uncharacterized protein n=1 Tax=Sesamum latifolium TaxID=2727402 RepID=A0AAW2TRT6_9LAMI
MGRMGRSMACKRSKSTLHSVRSARELIFRYKIKLCDAHKAWMKSPEVLQNCSVGLDFPNTDDVYQENAAPLKLLNFYRATN